MPKKDRTFFGRIIGGNLVDQTQEPQSVPDAEEAEVEEGESMELLTDGDEIDEIIEGPVEVEERIEVRGSVVAQEEPVVTRTTETGQHEEWLSDFEGQLNIDMYQTKDNVIVKSTIAGVRPEDIDITVANDMLTIKGARRREEQVSEDDYFYQECYWGNFSRSVIIPVDIDSEHIEADLKDGILTVVVPKAAKAKTKKIKVKGL
ncbi:MAG: Hsp20/alpha crystallin family protein [Candidatus Doudnabacteria bacterium]|nr:Hsp20/alpha crystallin family protein [Candidatus Doudnabacteria bacterium]